MACLAVSSSRMLMRLSFEIAVEVTIILFHLESINVRQNGAYCKKSVIFVQPQRR